ncbi:MAG: hypothetical protein KGQ59_04540 [Bdellovibrionales bacterium]|nr:hypothetical protein [Bdellovibrionales bacterium]
MECLQNSAGSPQDATDGNQSRCCVVWMKKPLFKLTLLSACWAGLISITVTLSAQSAEKKKRQQIYSQAYQVLNQRCKKDSNHAASIEGAIDHFEKINDSGVVCDQRSDWTSGLSEKTLAAESLRRLKLLKEAQTIESFFTYEILYSGLDLSNPNAHNQLVNRICPTKPYAYDFSSIASKEAKRQRINFDSDLNDADKKLIHSPGNICTNPDQTPSEFKKLVQKIAEGSIQKFKTIPQINKQIEITKPSALSAINPLIEKMKTACGKQGDNQTKTNSKPFDPYAELKANNSKFAVSDRSGQQANMPARIQKAEITRAEFDASRVSSVISEISLTPYGRLLVTSVFRKKLGIPKLTLGPNEIKETCNQIKKKYPMALGNTPVFKQEDVKSALTEIRTQMPKSLADTLPYRYPEHFKPSMKDIDRKLAYEIELQPDGAAAIQILTKPPRLLSRTCDAIRSTEKKRQWNETVQQGLAYVSTGLMVAGAAISLTGMGAPAGLALMSAGVSASLVDHSVNQAHSRDQFILTMARGQDQFYTNLSGAISAEQMDQNRTRAIEVNQAKNTYDQQTSENNTQLGIDLVTTATGFGATKVLGGLKYGSALYDVAEAGVVSAITAQGDAGNFVQGFVGNFAASQAGSLSHLRRPKTGVLGVNTDLSPSKNGEELFVSEATKTSGGTNPFPGLKEVQNGELPPPMSEQILQIPIRDKSNNKAVEYADQLIIKEEAHTTTNGQPVTRLIRVDGPIGKMIEQLDKKGTVTILEKQKANDGYLGYSTYKLLDGSEKRVISLTTGRYNVYKHEAFHDLMKRQRENAADLGPYSFMFASKSKDFQGPTYKGFFSTEELHTHVKDAIAFLTIGKNNGLIDREIEKKIKLYNKSTIYKKSKNELLGEIKINYKFFPLSEEMQAVGSLETVKNKISDIQNLIPKVRSKIEDIKSGKSDIKTAWEGQRNLLAIINLDNDKEIYYSIPKEVYDPSSGKNGFELNDFIAHVEKNLTKLDDMSLKLNNEISGLWNFFIKRVVSKESPTAREYLDFKSRLANLSKVVSIHENLPIVPEIKTENVKTNSFYDR